MGERGRQKVKSQMKKTRKVKQNKTMKKKHKRADTDTIYCNLRRSVQEKPAKDAVMFLRLLEKLQLVFLGGAEVEMWRFLDYVLSGGGLSAW